MNKEKTSVGGFGKLVSLVLSLMLIISMSAFPALAAGSTASVPFSYYHSGDETIITGYYGSDADLVIPAEINGKRVTDIESYAFVNCPSLTSVTIPEGVTCIGANAFQECTSLESVTIPEGVIQIEGEAFLDCPSLKSVTIPNSVGYISYNSFGYYYNRDIINKVDGFKIIGYKNSAANAYAQENGFDFESLGEGNSFAYSENQDGTIRIFDYYGDKDELVNLDIPAEINGKSVTSIGYVFSDCTNLKSVTIPEGVTSIEDYAFSGCASLESVTIPESVTSIGYSAFEDCTNLKSVTIPESVTSIGYSAFKDCTSLENVTISEGVTSIENDAFWGCTSLKAVTIPKSVTYIGEFALGYYYDVDGYYYGIYGFEITGYKNSAADAYARDNYFDFESLGEGNPFAYDGLEIFDYYGDKDELVKLDIPAEINGNSVTSIGYYAFAHCANLESITIPEGVTSIGDWAFAYCTSLKAVTIPKSVISIGSIAFGYYYDDETGEDIKIDGFKIIGYKNSAAYVYARDNGFEFESLGEVSPLVCNELEDGTLEIIDYCGDDRDTMTELVIPAEIDGKKVTSIGDVAFENYTSLESVTIPKSVTSIGYNAFGYYDDEEEWGIKVDGFKITGYKNSAAYAYARDNGFDFESLGEVSPFAYNELEDGTLEIIDYFGDDSDLAIPAQIDGKKVTLIEESAFYGCTSLESVTIQEGVRRIKSDAFDNCPNLKSVTIPKSVTDIGEYACGFIKIRGSEDGRHTLVEGFKITGYKKTTAEYYATRRYNNCFEFIALEEKSGDINGDGELDLSDSTILERHLAQFNGYETIDESVADVNRDGEVNLLDSTILERHLAKWSGYETLPYNK